MIMLRRYPKLKEIILQFILLDGHAMIVAGSCEFSLGNDCVGDLNESKKQPSRG